MVTNIVKVWCYMLMILQQTVKGAEVSYNQPKLSSRAWWNPNAVIFADEMEVSSVGANIFVDRNNNIYVADHSDSQILIWFYNGTRRARIYLDYIFKPLSIFVTIDGNIYVSSFNTNQVEKWTLNATKGISVENFSYGCHALFVDITNYLYCSLPFEHRIIKKSFDVHRSTPTNVGGNGTRGSTSNMLNRPYGIFVDINFDLYVADCLNNRVQRFIANQTDGITVVGNSTEKPSITLQCPVAVFTDADKYLFIVDKENHRIIGSNSDGFYCLAGCLSGSDASSYPLRYPIAAAFDTDGNIFVVRDSRDRIHKFILMTNASDTFSNIESIYSSALTADSETFVSNVCTESAYYYEAIQMKVIESGRYSLISKSTIDIYGNIYQNSFDPSKPTDNLYLQNNGESKDAPFQFVANLQVNFTYILIMSMNDSNVKANFSIFVSGPNNIQFHRINSSSSTQSIYSSELTENSQMYLRVERLGLNYYQALQMEVIQTGQYIISGKGTFNTYGAIYKPAFIPSTPFVNLDQGNYDGCDGRQFKLAMTLSATVKYILVVTTLLPGMKGNFSIIASGPNNVIFTRIGNSTIVQSIYSSELTSTSKTYIHAKSHAPNYYEAVQMKVIETGKYIICSGSNVNLYGSIYNGSFFPYNPNENLLAEDDDACYFEDFKLDTDLDTNSMYTLVIATVKPYVTGNFSIMVFGPDYVIFNRIDLPAIVQSTYSSVITENSQVYSPDGCIRLTYYEAVEVKVIEPGNYIIISRFGIGLHAYIYDSTFNPSIPHANLLAQGQIINPYFTFKLAVVLHINKTYVLLISAISLNNKGNFSLIVSGPNSVIFNRIDNSSSTIQTGYSSMLAENSQTYGRGQCISSTYYYEAVQVNVIVDGFYTLLIDTDIMERIYLYQGYFNPRNPFDNFLSSVVGSCGDQRQLFDYLLSNVAYILIVTTFEPNMAIKKMSITASGANNVTLRRINGSLGSELIYSSVLNENTQTYSRECGKSNYYYETIEVRVQETGNYSFGSFSSIASYGYIYINSFNPFNPIENLLAGDGIDCDDYRFQIKVQLQAPITYILVVTTFDPNVKGNFTVHATGPSNITLNRTIISQNTCSIGDWCHFYTKGIGFTLDDILREQIRPNTTLSNQSLLVKIGAALTTIMFVAGLINSLFSLLTFANKDLREVGCGVYLLASSITSLLTMIMFIVKYWFVVLTQINSFIPRGGCIIIEPLLKLFVYLDAWLNACIAVERMVAVSKGVKFDKAKSKRIARCITIILPLCIMGTIIHEPMHRDLFHYQTEIYKSEIHDNWTNKSEELKVSVNESRKYVTDTNIWCIIRYSLSVQQYNTFILFFHLMTPFIANLFSALFIIFGVARQRSVAQTTKKYKEHVYQQLSEHKQLIISPVILLILALPRLIISLLSGCMKAASNQWLYLSAYFISFTPSILVFVVFVLPSQRYSQAFKESITKRWRKAC